MSSVKECDMDVIDVFIDFIDLKIKKGVIDLLSCSDDMMQQVRYHVNCLKEISTELKGLKNE